MNQRKPCARCGCLSSDIKHKAFGMRGFVVICVCCGQRAESSTQKKAITEWNRQFRLGN